MTKLKPPFLKEIRLPPTPDSSAFPLCIPLFSKGFSLRLTHPLTIIVGENGAGKSTFLEALAAKCGFNMKGGGKDHIYDSETNLNQLTTNLALSWLPKINHGFFFRAETFYAFADYIDALAKENGPTALGPYGRKSLHARSHGESFTALFDSRYKGFFILDEPEAALSPQRQIEFLARLKSLLSAGQSQVIMATHSPILMAYPNCQLLELQDGVLRETAYQQTAHYKTYRRFLENPLLYLNPIFEETPE